jgi:hypothetical protein
VDGGEVDPYPHAYPAGGILDPRSGAWSELPDDFTEGVDGWGVNASGGRWAATYGQVYDTETSRVTTLPRPDGAPDLDVSAVWAQDSLLAFGGVTFGQQTETTNRAWLYTP